MSGPPSGTAGIMLPAPVPPVFTTILLGFVSDSGHHFVILQEGEKKNTLGESPRWLTLVV